MSRFNTIRYPDYSGGLNNTSSASEIKRNQASRLENWDITFAGELRQRAGITQIGDTLNAAATGFGQFLRKSGSVDLMVMESGTLRYLNSTVFDSLDDGFTDENVWMENVLFQDRIYISSESNTIHYWDRVSTTTNSSLTDLGAAVPHGNVLRWYQNHMFTVNNVTVSGTVHANRLYWSALGDPTTWDTTNDFIELPGSGRVITMNTIGNVLVIFKEHSILFLEGYGNSDWRITASSTSLTNIDDAVGCLAVQGTVKIGNSELWFMDEEGFIRRIFLTGLDAFRKDIVSNNIQGSLDSINKVQLEKTTAWLHNDKVHFGVPTGTNNDLDLVFDITTFKRTGKEAWTTYTGWTPGQFLSFLDSTTPSLYFTNNANGKIYKQLGTNDDGVAVSARWDGMADDYDKPERFRKYAYGYVDASNQGDIDIYIYSSVDGGPFSRLDVKQNEEFAEFFNLSGSGSTLGPTGSFLLGPTGNNRLAGGENIQGQFFYGGSGGQITGKTVRHSIRHSELGKQPNIKGFTSHYSERSLR